MLKRLLVGLLIGLVVGGLMAFALVKGLGMVTFATGGGAVLAYLFAALTGVLTGLIAGKPIWSKGGQIEAGLKAVFGAAISAGGMFALRQWAHVHLDLSMIAPHAQGELGQLPMASLPLIAGVLGGFFELDNTGTEEKDEKKGAKGAAVAAAPKSARAGANGKARVEAEDTEAEEDVEIPSKKAKR